MRRTRPLRSVEALTELGGSMRKTVLAAVLTLLAALPGVPASAATRAMEVKDVVELRQIPETRIAPDGRRVAFVVTEPAVATNKVVYRLMVADFDTPGRARSIYAGDRITNLGILGLIFVYSRLKVS